MTDEKAPRCEFDRDELVHRFETTIPGTVDAIPPVVARIMEEVRRMGCAAGKEFDIEVAVNEALANAVQHGCANDPCKQVEVTVECDPAIGMLIVVKDPGSGFDPTNVPSPIVGKRLYADHGRGIFLINELMDEVRYMNGGTEIWMLKK
jgi:serine/threonine-protein kinase RsbW